MILPVRTLFTHSAFRLAVLLWTIGFFAVFMPAHQRGIITLPAAIQTTSAAENTPDASCPKCITQADSEKDSQATPSTPVPIEAPAGCAICLLKVGLDLPSEPVTLPCLVALLDYLIQVQEPQTPPLVVTYAPRHGRAPPA